MNDLTGAEWLSPAEAARRVRVRRDLIDKWVARGLVTSHRVGNRRIVVHVEDCEIAELAWRRRALAATARAQNRVTVDEVSLGT